MAQTSLCAGVHKSLLEAPLVFIRFPSTVPAEVSRVPAWKRAHEFTGVHQDGTRKGFSQPGDRYYLNSVHLAHWPQHPASFMAERLSMQSELKALISTAAPSPHRSGYIYYENIVQLYHKLKCVYILPRGCRQKSLHNFSYLDAVSKWDLILITEHFELHPWPCELDSSQIPSWHEVEYK